MAPTPAQSPPAPRVASFQPSASFVTSGLSQTKPSTSELTSIPTSPRPAVPSVPCVSPPSYLDTSTSAPNPSSTPPSYSALSTLHLGVEQPRSLHATNTMIGRRPRVKVPATPERFFVREKEKLSGTFPHVGETTGGTHLPSIANGRRTPYGYRRPPDHRHSTSASSSHGAYTPQTLC